MDLAQFEGHWRLSRAVRDEAAGYLRFEGTAQLAPDEEGLAYEEEGTWTLAPWGRLSAGRRYLWRDRGSRVEVLFADGQHFHFFDPGEGGAGTDHPCGPDLYRVTYDFTRWPDWRSEWRVTGPRKAYVMVTAYLPA